MADFFYGVVKEDESAAAGCDPRPAQRRRMGIRLPRLAPGVSTAAESSEEDSKRKKKDGVEERGVLEGDMATDEKDGSGESSVVDLIEAEGYPKYGVASSRGGRRDMEDAVAIHPLSSTKYSGSRWHYFGLYDGHGCSHVATRCRERLHGLVQEELFDDAKEDWNRTMERSFTRMDKEVALCKETVTGANCRCELQTPDCDAVGSAAVVSVITPEKIIVANCGDSRAVLCRNGKPVPLSTDHKPDRPDELDRIQAAGGRVIYWDGPRVLGVLATSRAIGDNYLKPYVICEPEVTITDRTDDDECLILASDGLWDVVSNETACAVASMCIRGKVRTGRRRAAARVTEEEKVGSRNRRRSGEISDQACGVASVLLTRLALARYSTDNVSVIVIDLRRGTR